MIEVQPQGPYMLGGYSFGGYLALEVAQQLQAVGQEVDLLVMFDTRLVIFDNDPTEQFDDAAYWYAAFHDEVPISLEHLKSLEPDEQVDYVLDFLKKADNPSFISPHDRGHSRLKVEKANVKAFFNYHARPYSGRITVFRSTEGGDTQPDLGWGQLASGGVDTFDVPGDHHTVMHNPNVEVLGQFLREHIRQINASRYSDSDEDCVAAAL